MTESGDMHGAIEIMVIFCSDGDKWSGGRERVKEEQKLVEKAFADERAQRKRSNWTFVVLLTEWLRGSLSTSGKIYENLYNKENVYKITKNYRISILTNNRPLHSLYTLQ